MKKWWQKGLMATVAVLTLGIITPNHEIWASEPTQLPAYAPQYKTTASEFDAFVDEQLSLSTIDLLKIAAKEQAYIKFGTRVGPQIEEQFNGYILPKMEEAIEMTIGSLDEPTINQLYVTEKPSGDYSERIFHIKNSETKKDVIRFHVRIENRVADGFYYNFHYHTFHDQFITHINLGEIYWSKNTPPKWLS